MTMDFLPITGRRRRSSYSISRDLSRQREWWTEPIKRVASSMTEACWMSVTHVPPTNFPDWAVTHNPRSGTSRTTLRSMKFMLDPQSFLRGG